jgi:hypothetical protein
MFFVKLTIQGKSCAPPGREPEQDSIPVASPLANILCASGAPVVYHYFFKHNNRIADSNNYLFTSSPFYKNPPATARGSDLPSPFIPSSLHPQVPSPAQCFIRFRLKFQSDAVLPNQFFKLCQFRRQKVGEVLIAIGSDDDDIFIADV